MRGEEKMPSLQASEKSRKPEKNVPLRKSASAILIDDKGREITQRFFFKSGEKKTAAIYRPEGGGRKAKKHLYAIAKKGEPLPA